MKPTLTLLAALLLAPVITLHAAETPKPAVKVTQELLNSIHVTPKLIFDPMPAYGQKYLPFAMAASMESTKNGRLWTCWTGGQDGPNAYLLASYSDDQGKSWRDPVFVIAPQAHGLKMGTRLGSFWCDPKGGCGCFSISRSACSTAVAATAPPLTPGLREVDADCSKKQIPIQ